MHHAQHPGPPGGQSSLDVPETASQLEQLCRDKQSSNWTPTKVSSFQGLLSTQIRHQFDSESVAYRISGRGLCGGLWALVCDVRVSCTAHLVGLAGSQSKRALESQGEGREGRREGERRERERERERDRDRD